MQGLKHFAGYLIGAGATALLGFLSVPLLVRLLGEAEFGRWALVEPILLMGAQAALLGTNWGVIKLVAHDRLAPFSTFYRILARGWIAAVLVAMVSGCILLAMGFPLADGALISALVFVDGVFLLSLAALRATNSSFAFSGVQILRALVVISLLTAALFGVLHLTQVGDVLQLRLVAGMAALSLATILIRTGSHGDGLRQGSNRSTAEMHREAVRYGLPMLITALLTMVLDFASRYLVAAYLDLVLLAQFVIYTKLVSAVSLLVITPFSLWWAAERFRRIRDLDGGRRYFPLVASAFLIVLLAASGSLWLSAEPLMAIFAPGIPNRPVITALLLAGAVFAGMAYPLNIGLLNEGKTSKNVYAVLAGALTHLVLCTLLIPPLGLLGAAIATAFGYFVYMVAFAKLSQRHYFVPFAYGELCRIAALATVALFMISSAIPAGDVVGSAVRVAMFIGALCILGWPVYIRIYRYRDGSVGGPS